MGVIYRDMHRDAFNPQSAKVLTIDSSKIPAAGVVAFHIALKTGTAAGANLDFGKVKRIKVLAAGTAFIDVLRDHFRAWVQRLTRGNRVLAAADKRFTIPFYLPDAKGNARYTGQFPQGLSPQIQIEFDTFTGDSTDKLSVGWTMVRGIAPTHYPTLIGQDMGIGANAKKSFTFDNHPGAIRGYAIRTTNLKVARLSLSGEQVDHLENEQGLILEAEANEQQLEKTNALTSPLFVKLHPERLAGVGSKIELETDASWPASGEELTLYSLIPQGR